MSTSPTRFLTLLKEPYLDAKAPEVTGENLNRRRQAIDELIKFTQGKTCFSLAHAVEYFTRTALHQHPPMTVAIWLDDIGTMLRWAGEPTTGRLAATLSLLIKAACLSGAVSNNVALRG